MLRIKWLLLIHISILWRLIIKEWMPWHYLDFKLPFSISPFLLNTHLLTTQKRFWIDNTAFPPSLLMRKFSISNDIKARYYLEIVPRLTAFIINGSQVTSRMFGMRLRESQITCKVNIIGTKRNHFAGTNWRYLQHLHYRKVTYIWLYRLSLFSSIKWNILIRNF